MFMLLIYLQVTRVVLLWVNNHFNDFEGDPAMTQFLEEFENNLEREVRIMVFLREKSLCGKQSNYYTCNSLLCYFFSLAENGWTSEAVKYCMCC